MEAQKKEKRHGRCAACIIALVILIIAFFMPIISASLFDYSETNISGYSLTRDFFSDSAISILKDLFFLTIIMMAMFFIGLIFYLISGIGYSSEKTANIATTAIIGYVVLAFILITQLGSDIANAGLNIYMSVGSLIAYFWLRR